MLPEQFDQFFAIGFGAVLFFLIFTFFK